MITHRSFITGLIALVVSIALVFLALPAAADIDLVGTIKAYLGGHPPANWKWADGSCAEDVKYPELVRIIHDGDNWPYGRCDETHFRLPDLRGNIKAARYLIRVR